MSPDAQRLLGVAAVAGRWVRHDWLAAVAHRSDEELTGPLREAVDRGLLLVTPIERAGQEVYEFRHALLQEAVYADLLPGQRARLHGAYASAIVGAAATRQAAPWFAAELAEHWYLAGQPGEALVWSVRAADSAERVYAHAEAARHCERAVELWDQVSGAADLAGTNRVSLHMRAARAWECAGDEIRALAHVEEALRQVDPVADPARTGLLHHLRGWYGAGKADLDAVLAANREAVRLVPAEPPSTARARVLMGYGRALHIQAGRYEEAAAVHEQTLTAARRAGSHPQTVQAMAALGHARAVTGEVAAGIALLREACASADADLADSGEFPGDHEWRVARVAHVLLSDALLKTGRLEEAAEVALRGWESLRRLGLADHRLACLLLGYAVEALLGLGRWDQAARISEPLAHRPASFANAILQPKLAELEAARGEPEAALARLDQVREQGWRPGPEHSRELGQRRAEVQLWLAPAEPALADVNCALDAVTGTSQERFAGWLACLGVRALADLAAHARARQDPAAAAGIHQRRVMLEGRLAEMTRGPFTVGTLMPTSAGAERALYEAELTRLDDTADPAAWQAAARRVAAAGTRLPGRLRAVAAGRGAGYRRGRRRPGGRAASRRPRHRDAA